MNTTSPDPTNEAAKRLTLTRETLRTLTSTELRLVAGGISMGCTSTYAACYAPKSYGCRAD